MPRRRNPREGKRAPRAPHAKRREAEMRSTTSFTNQVAGGLGSRMLVLVAAAVLPLAACSGDDAANGGGGGTPDGQAPMTRTLTWTQAPGTEIVQCHTFKLPNATPVEIERIKF